MTRHATESGLSFAWGMADFDSLPVPASLEAMEPRLLLSAGSPAATLVSMSWQGQTVQVAAGEWIVRLASAGTQAVDLISSLAAAGVAGTDVSMLPGGHFAQLTAPSAAAGTITAWAASTPAVTYVEPNVALSLGDSAIQSIPNDPSFVSQWALNTIGASAGAIDINAPEAWNLTTGSSTVVVAVIDTGVDYTHPDLAANIWRNPGEIPGDHIDNDHDGYVDDVYGWDFANNDSTPLDDNGHGTHVSGIIGAVGNNGAGVTGVNWNVKIMPLKFMDSTGSGYESDAVAALEYATMMKTRYGVNVVAANNSWGGGGSSAALGDAIAAAGNAGILFVAAAGNGGADGRGDNNDTTPNYPSNYTASNVIAVAATDQTDRMASFSNYGATSVDLAAPGVNILSTTPNNHYASWSGTSMATPFVTGVVALLAAYDPSATAAQIKAAILAGVDHISSLTGKCVSGGRLDALGALEHLGATPTPTPTPDPTAGPHEPNDTITQATALTLSAAGTASVSGVVGDGAASAYDVDLFAVQAPAAGTLVLEISAVRSGSSLDSYLRLFDSSGRQVASNDDAIGQDSRITYTVAHAGTYYVGVSGYGNARYDPTRAASGSAGSTGAFALTATYTAAAAQPPPVQPPPVQPPVQSGSYSASSAAYAFEDITAVGRQAFAYNTDDATVTLGPSALGGFQFPFYGQTYGTVSISSNGLITFGGASAEYRNSNLTASPAEAAIAPLWDDLVVAGAWTSAVQWQILASGTNQQRLVVQWTDVSSLDSRRGGTVTFEAVLYANGTIRFNYRDLDTRDGFSAAAATATVGIKSAGTSAAGANVLAVSFNSTTSSLVGTGKSLLLTPVSAVAADPGTGTGTDPGTGADPGDPVFDLIFDATTPATYTDAAGNTVTVTLTGPGVGTVSLPALNTGNAELIALTGTDATSVMTIVTSLPAAAAVRGAPAPQTIVGGIDVTGDLGGIAARSTELTGDLTVSGGLATLWLNEVLGPAVIDLGASAVAANLRLGQVSDLSLMSAARIASLSASDWSDVDGLPDSVIAPSIGRLTVGGDHRSALPGDFDASLTLTDSAARASLDCASIHGQATGDWTLAAGARGISIGGDATGQWTILGNVGTVVVRGLVSGTWDITGNVRALLIGGDAAGDLTITGNVGTIAVGGAAAGMWDIAGSVRAIFVGRDATGDWTIVGDVGSIMVRGTAPGNWDITGSVRLIYVVGDAAGDWHVTGDVGAIRVRGQATGTWTIDGSTGWTRIGSATGDWSATVGGDSQGLACDHNLSGQWQSRSLGSLTVGGNMAAAQVNLTSRATGRHRAMGQVRVAGWMDGSTVRSAGDIGSLTAGGVRDSTVSAGVRQGMHAMCGSAADFDVLASIGTVRITGAAHDSHGRSAINTTIAAPTVATALLPPPAGRDRMTILDLGRMFR